MYCNKCGFKYEGNFCPICGAKAKKINLPPQGTTFYNKSANPNQSVNPYEYMYSNYKYNPQREIPQSLAEAVATTRKQKSKLRGKNKATQNQPVAPINSFSSADKKNNRKPIIKRQANTIKQAPVRQKKKTQSPVTPNSQQVTPENSVMFNQVNTIPQSHIPTTQPVVAQSSATSYTQPFANQTQPTAQTPNPTATPSVAPSKKQRQPLSFWQIIIIVVVAVFSCSLITTVLPAGLFSCAYLFEEEIYPDSKAEDDFSKAKKIQIGDIVEDECNIAYSVTDVSKVAQHEGFTPEKGYEFISVTLFITNNDKNTNYPYQELSVYADDIKCNLINSARYNPYSEELFKGKSMAVKYVFEVPQDATEKTLYLSYDYGSMAKLDLE